MESLWVVAGNAGSYSSDARWKKAEEGQGDVSKGLAAEIGMVGCRESKDATNGCVISRLISRKRQERHKVGTSISSLSFEN